MVRIESWVWIGDDEVTGILTKSMYPLDRRHIVITPVARCVHPHTNEDIVMTRGRSYVLGQSHENHPERSTVRERLLKYLPLVRYTGKP